MSESVPLQNAKQEAFAVAIARGVSGRDAYKSAGYKPRNDATADACASRLLAEAKVAARVKELQKAAAERAGVTIEQVIEELVKIGFANLQDFVNIGGDDTGDVITSLRDLAPRHAAAVQEFTVETYMEGKGDDARPVKRVKLKLHDKRAALVDIGRHLGGFNPTQRHEHTGKDGKPIEVDAMTPVQRARRIAFALARAKRAPKDQEPAT